MDMSHIAVTHRSQIFAVSGVRTDDPWVRSATPLYWITFDGLFLKHLKLQIACNKYNAIPVSERCETSEGSVSNVIVLVFQ